MFSICEEIEVSWGRNVLRSGRKVRGPVEWFQLRLLLRSQNKLLLKMGFRNATFPKIQNKMVRGQKQIAYKLAVYLFQCTAVVGWGWI